MRFFSFLVVLAAFCSGCARVVVETPAVVGTNLGGLIRGTSQEVPTDPGLGVLVFEPPYWGEAAHGQIILVPRSRGGEEEADERPLQIVQKNQNKERKKIWKSIGTFGELERIKVDLASSQIQFFFKNKKVVTQKGLAVRQWGRRIVWVTELWMLLKPGHYEFEYYSFLGRGPFKRAADRGTLSIWVSNDPTDEIYQGIFVSWVKRIRGPSLERGYWGYY